MATSAYELLAAYVSLTVRGAEIVVDRVDAVDRAVKQITNRRALILLESNAREIAADVTSVETVFVRTNEAVREVNERLAITHQRILQIANAGSGLATRQAAEVNNRLAITHQRILEIANASRGLATRQASTGGGFGKGGLVPIGAQTGQSVIPSELVNPGALSAASSVLESMVSRIGAVTLAYTAMANARQAAIVSFNAALATEDDNASFEALIGNATKATAILQELHEFASNSVFSFPELRQAAIRMAAVGIPAEKLTQTLKAIATVSQATGADINNVIRQYTQAMGGATLRAEELQILVENNVPVYQLLAKSMNKTTDEVRKLGREGKLAAVELEKAFLLGAESTSILAKAAAALNETTKGAFKSILQNAIEIGEAFARWSLSGLTEEIDGIRQAMEVIAFLANKLSPSDQVGGDKKAPAATSDVAIRSALTAFGAGFIADALTAASVIGKVTDKITGLTDAVKDASRTRVELAEGVTQAEMEGVEKVVEAQNKALADAESRFAQYWQRLRRTWQQEQDSLFDDNLNALTRDTRTADALRQSLMSPMDEFKAKIAEAQQLLEQGLISDETFTGVFNRASKELDDIKRKVSSIQNVRTSFIVGQSGELSFRMQASRTQDLQLIEAKQQSKMDAERNRILNDIRNGLQQRQEQAKPEVSAETFPTELF